MKVKELSDSALAPDYRGLGLRKRFWLPSKSDFKARWPDYSAFLESDPAIAPGGGRIPRAAPARAGQRRGQGQPARLCRWQ